MYHSKLKGIRITKQLVSIPKANQFEHFTKNQTLERKKFLQQKKNTNFFLALKAQNKLLAHQINKKKIQLFKHRNKKNSHVNHQFINFKQFRLYVKLCVRYKCNIRVFYQQITKEKKN